MWWKMGGSKWKGLIVGRRRKKSTDKLEIYIPTSIRPPSIKDLTAICKMFYFRAFVRSFPINNNCVRLFWSENHKVKLRWLFDKNPLCCFTTNYYSRPALKTSIPKELVGFTKLYIPSTVETWFKKAQFKKESWFKKDCCYNSFFST